MKGITRERLIRLKKEGIEWFTISRILGLSKYSVKNYCQEKQPNLVIRDEDEVVSKIETLEQLLNLESEVM